MPTHEPPRPEPASSAGSAPRIDLSPSSGRVRVTLAGEAVADSTRTLLLRERNHAPVHYFPRADVRMDLLTRTAHTTHCPYKGDASYWTVEAAGRTAENAVWSYERPVPGMAGIAGYVAFYRDRMEIWPEEEEPDPE